ASLVATGMTEKVEMEEIKRAGGVGELLGNFFDEAGNAFETSLSNRALALGRDDIRNRRIVAVAGGKVKVRAIKAILASRYLSGLITDERTARSLVEEKPGG